MLEIFGNIINELYKILNNYGLTLIIIGTIIGFTKIISSFMKIKQYKINKKIKPLLDDIDKMNISEEQKHERTYQILKQYNYNIIPSIIINVIKGIFIMSFFVVMINPTKYIGIPENFTQSFLYYENIFSSSIDIIMPFIISLIVSISPELGKPKNLINKKNICKNFILYLISNIIFASVFKHIYIIYYLGITIGQLLSDLILIKTRRKLL